MIEAVTSAVSNAQVARSNLAQTDVQSAPAPQQVDAPSAPQAPFVSPYISVNTEVNEAVLQIRDSDTGDVVRQFPSESALRARQQVEAELARVREQRDIAQGENNSESPVQAPTQQVSEVSGTASSAGSAQQASSALSSAAQTQQVAQAPQTTSIDVSA